MTVFIVLFIHTGVAVTAFAEAVASVEVSLGGITVTPAVSGVTFMMLRVADPQGEVIGEQTTEGGSITWSPPAGAQEGLYTYEVRVGFGERNRTREDPQQQAPRTKPWRQSGTVYVTGGAILPPTSMERSFLEGIFSGISNTFAKIMDLITPPVYADVLHYDDVIITGSLGIGFDCADGESFGFDSILFKEHNLRLYFNDTSYTASYPANDWRITINDSTNGGANFFSIDDVSNGSVPFKIEADAPSNSLYIEDYGRIGIGTALPVVEVHIADSDTPTVRLEQDSSGGWTPQTWDLAGNESNFFIRDATNGAKLPFRIQPNTPTSTLCLKSDGDGRVGIGTWEPEESLHVEGNVLVVGNLELRSSRDCKNNIQTLQATEAINALSKLRPVKFKYKVDPDEESIGFIAEEVPDLVATNNRKSLSTMDVVAVLTKVVQEQQKVIDQLSHKVADLEKEP